jgi:peptide/nickel transport system substrate-binding protein
MIHGSQPSISRRTLVKLAGATPLIGAAGLTGSRAAAQEATPVQGGTFTYGNAKPSVNIINPLNTIGTGQNVIIDAVFLRLIYGRQWGDGLNPDPNGEIDLAVAETMTEIETDRVWEFTLRRNVLWHDGRPVTADDVILGIWLKLNKNVISTSETSPIAIKGAARLQETGAAVGDISVEGATKLGDYAVRIELERPIPNYWVNWTVGYWPMPAHIFGAMPFDQLFAEPYATAPIGNGPFKATRFIDGQYIELEANPDFYLGRPLLDKYIVRFGERDTLTAALEAQEIDGMNLNAGPDYDRLVGLGYLNASQAPFDYPVGFAINAERWPDHAAGLNRAIQHAMDVELLSTQLNSGTLRPSNNLFGHIVGYEQPPAGFETRGYDPDRARAILTEIGWDPNQELKWLVWSAPTGMADAEQAMLAEVGIKTTYRQIDVAAIIDELYRKGDYDITKTSFGNSQFFEENWEYIKCGWNYDQGGFNYSRYCNNQVDELWQQGLDELDATKRKETFDQINLLLNATPPQATLYRQTVPYLWNQRVRGAYPYQYQLPVRPALEKVWLAE